MWQGSLLQHGPRDSPWNAGRVLPRPWLQRQRHGCIEAAASAPTAEDASPKEIEQVRHWWTTPAHLQHSTSLYTEYCYVLHRCRCGRAWKGRQKRRWTVPTSWFQGWRRRSAQRAACASRPMSPTGALPCYKQVQRQRLCTCLQNHACQKAAMRLHGDELLHMLPQARYDESCRRPSRRKRWRGTGLRARRKRRRPG